MSGHRILIVDDDPWILRMVSTLLEKKGFVVGTAGDGEEALRRAEQMKPDLIITDVMMPRLDGWGLVRTLRSRPDLAFIPVIFLTALGGDEDRIKGFRLGADDYLPKPFRFEELDLRVGSALRKAGSRPTLDGGMTAVPNAVPPPMPSAAPPPMPAVAPVAAAPTPPPPPVAAPKPAGIHGNLEQLGLSSLLVMVEMERKSGILRIERADCKGRIFVKQGRVIAARCDGKVPDNAKKGAEAVYFLLTWSAGRFDFSVVDVDMEDEVQATTTHLLMEGARLIDEGAR